MAKTRDEVYISMIADTKKAVGGFLKLATTITAVVAVARKLVAVFKENESLYRAQALAETQLQAALLATENQIGLTTTQLVAMASEMQRLIVVSDDEIISAQALMTTFTQIGGKVFPDAIKAAADMSAMFGQDLQQSVISLGTALNDPIVGIGRLRRIGISFTEEQKESIEQFVEQNDIMSAQRVILDELGAEFGGVAEAMGREAVNASEALRLAQSDLREEFGRLTTNALEPARVKMTEYAHSIRGVIANVNDLFEATSDFELEGPIDQQLSDLNERLVIQKSALAGLNDEIENWGREGNLVRGVVTTLLRLLNDTDPIKKSKEAYAEKGKELEGLIAITERQISGITALNEAGRSEVSVVDGLTIAFIELGTELRANLLPVERSLSDETALGIAQLREMRDQMNALAGPYAGWSAAAKAQIGTLIDLIALFEELNPEIEDEKEILDETIPTLDAYTDRLMKMVRGTEEFQKLRLQDSIRELRAELELIQASV